MKKEQFINMLEQHLQLKEDLFIRGFLITNRTDLDLEAFPFYGSWNVSRSGGFQFITHPLTGAHIYQVDKGHTFFLMGHAYNPFTMEIDEVRILKRIADSYGTGQYVKRINELTGVFVYGCIIDDVMTYLVDPSGMQSAAAGIIDNHFYLTSHPQLVGDICGLDMDPFVSKLIKYKWYGRVMGPYLPGDLTPFTELKRLVPSIAYKYAEKKGVIRHKRFWPLKNIDIVYDEKEYNEVITQAAGILHNNMQLVSDKWDSPWISLTGGIDSNTTFAAANGIYDKFKTFSYISAEKEIRDAEAAKTISERFDVPHYEYQIPDTNDGIELFEERRELFRHNNGYVAELYDNEARKKFYLRDHADCDVEVKSWVSETIRAYWYKHYGRKSMPPLSPKLFRNLYKIFILNRPLAHKIDKLFASYIKEFEYDKIPSAYPPADMHYNEVTWGSWGGLNISEMKYCFDITFIYNNRVFFDLMFRVPLEKRISDQHHLDMKKYLNPELYDMGIRIVNMKETDFRAFALNIIFTINSILPF